MFNKAIDMSDPSKILDERLKNLIHIITKVIYNNVCRGLFEEHKLIFSFLITIQINRKAGLVSDLLWSSFLRGAGVFDKTKLPINPEKNLITDSAWDLAFFLEISFEKYQGLT